MTAAVDYWVCRSCGDEVRLNAMHECPGPPPPKVPKKQGRPQGSKTKPR